MNIGPNIKLASLLILSCLACRYCFVLGWATGSLQEAKHYHQWMDAFQKRNTLIDWNQDQPSENQRSISQAKPPQAASPAPIHPNLREPPVTQPPAPVSPPAPRMLSTPPGSLLTPPPPFLFPLVPRSPADRSGGLRCLTSPPPSSAPLSPPSSPPSPPPTASAPAASPSGPRL